MPEVVPFEQLPDSDLIVGAVYGQGPSGTVQGEPLHRLLPGVGNQGGFRAAGSLKRGTVRYAVLFTSGADPDWPDRLDDETGLFSYFGDNKQPGSELHATSRSGNRLLRACFDALHGEPPRREEIPPFFVFRKAVASGGRDVKYLGLAVPGAADVPASSDLVAVWRTSSGERFQNYLATFTILDTGTVPRAWLAELQGGEALGEHCPEAFRRFVEEGTYTPLRAPRTRQWRDAGEQEPGSEADRALVETVYDFFKDDPWRFEACAIELWRMLAKESVTVVDATRPSVDGGRDAVGQYALGPEADRIHLRFSLEAKCYASGHFAGVREVARLISRLRHREFGVFVTTTGVSRQAYQELREDEHPVVVVCGRDIAEILKRHGHSTSEAVESWLQAQFSASAPNAASAPSSHAASG